MRALLFALMAEGQSIIHNYLPSPDTEAMIQAIIALGAQVTRRDNVLFVQGTAGNLSATSCPLNAGNSGQVLRFIPALAILSPHSIILTGDASITSNRPIAPLVGALEQLGATACYLEKVGFAPFEICGPIHAGKATLSGIDSQPVSGLLMALSFLPNPSELTIQDPHEEPWIALTLWWLKKFGAVVEHSDYKHYYIHGGLHIKGFEVTIPGDYSSAAFPLAASLVTARPVTLLNLLANDPQGDKELLIDLQKNGAPLLIKDDHVEIISNKTTLQGGTIDVNRYIDAVPILATLACFASSPTKLINARPARFKESDRLFAMQQELTKMGAQIESTNDTLTIYPSSLQPAELFSHHDHRIAMALCIAALGAPGISTIQNVRCIDKSYPQFTQHLQELGHEITSSSDSLRISGLG